MKRLIGFALLVFTFLFSFSLVSAQAITCPNQNDIILKLSGDTNAHGAIYSDTAPNYLREICYSTIFQQSAPPPTPAISRNCVANNILVRLEAPTNAHGQVPSVNTYTTNVCYPGLTCNSIGSGTCAPGEKEVVSLESPTNSHLGIAGTYANKICCSLTSILPGISSPVHRGVYFTNTLITFTGSCSTTPGTPIYTWSVKQNGQTVPGLPTSPQPSTFPYTFTSVGQVNIQLACSYASPSSTTKSEIGILVVPDSASDKAFAYIDEPVFNGIVNTLPPIAPGSPYFPTEVQFAAEDSFIVQVSGANGCNVACLAGYCRDLTENSPNSCSASTLPPNQLNGKLDIVNNPSSPSTSNWLPINFDWTFRGDDGWTYNGQSSSSSSQGFNEGPGKTDGYVYYNTKSNAINDKHIDLTVTYPASGGATATSMFTRDFTLGRCLANGNTFLNLNNQPQSTSNVAGACKGADNNPGTADDCCPTGNSCLVGSGGNYYCQFDGITQCIDFLDQTSCNGNTNPAIPLNSLTGGQIVGQCQYAKCQWSATANNGAGGCGVVVENYPQSPTTGQCTNPSGSPTTTCQYYIPPSICVNGQKRIDYNMPNGQPYASIDICYKNSITVPCGDLNFELSFFDYWQFFASALVIAFVYAAYLALGLRKHEK